jgi:hypothetical protein
MPLADGEVPRELRVASDADDSWNPVLGAKGDGAFEVRSAEQADGFGNPVLGAKARLHDSAEERRVAERAEVLRKAVLAAERR